MLRLLNSNLNTCGESYQLRPRVSLRCLPLRIEARVTKAFGFPEYRGSTLRGALGMALLQSSCALRRQRCACCILRQTCVYSYIFETPSPGEDDDGKRYSKAPHPFVFRLELTEPEHLQPGDSFSFEIVLIERAIEFLPYFVYALERMGEIGIGKGRGRFEVERVLSLHGFAEKPEVVYSDGMLRFPERVFDFLGAEEDCGNFCQTSLRLRFMTPLRIKYQGRWTLDPQFHVLIRNLVRRIENLNRYHGTGEMDLPVLKLIDLAESVRLKHWTIRWYDWERYSRRQDQRMKLGGLVGDAVYEGDLRPFLPLLVMGSWINLGKGTSFGLGRYCLENIE